MPRFQRSLVWFRRDLRCHDHAALNAALMDSAIVYCCFVFDRAILDCLPANDRRVSFIHTCVSELAAELAAQGGQLLVCHDSAQQAIPALAAQLQIDALFFNHDYEPRAIERDHRVSANLAAAGVRVFSFKDQVVFEKNDVLTRQGTPFSVFTPYKNAWLARLQAAPDEALPLYPCTARAGQWGQANAALNATAIVTPNVTSIATTNAALDPALAASALWRDGARAMPTLAELGFVATDLALPGGIAAAQQRWNEFVPRLGQYAARRDFPAQKGPSYLSVHLRFGTLSIRQLVRHAWQQQSDTWLSELIWREFYAMILFHHPHVTSGAFKPAYDAIIWEQGEQADAHFAAWCTGQTGYPLVDAAMLQLNRSGYMHNRLRMVTACFLIKDLGIDWRRGEAYFAQQLNDFDLAANNGGWQWCASSGCDAQPYFRIFNPVTQSEKFDPEGQFIVRYLPQLKALPPKARHAPWLLSPLEMKMAGLEPGKDYPLPLVLHSEARKQTLARYGMALGKPILPGSAAT